MSESSRRSRREREDSKQPTPIPPEPAADTTPAPVPPPGPELSEDQAQPMFPDVRPAAVPDAEEPNLTADNAARVVAAAALLGIKPLLAHDHTVAVRTFMDGAGQTTPRTPAFRPDDILFSRLRLIFEEAIELANSLGFEVHSLRHNIDGVQDLGFRRNYDLPRSLSETAKELADMQVVNTGTFLALGIDPGPVMEAVDTNNLAKLRGGHLDVHGKWVKPAGHPKPDIVGVLRSQGWEG